MELIEMPPRQCVRAIAEYIPSIIVSVDYSLAPEHKAPTQFLDSMKVYEWAQQNASSIGGDANKFFSIGGSAGATLLLAIANYLVAPPHYQPGQTLLD
jgi:versiconal hemiacetal acetate esterase